MTVSFTGSKSPAVKQFPLAVEITLKNVFWADRDHKTEVWKAIEASGKFCVNILHENQQHVSAQFGSRAEDKFAGIDWRPSDLGSPVLDGTLAHIDCTVHSVHDGGDHFVVFGAVQSMS